MKIRHLSILALFPILWIGYHLFENAREQAKVQRLPKTVSIRGSYAAKGGVAEASLVASLWHADARLQSISVGFASEAPEDCLGMGTDGIPIAPNGWNYRYFSAASGWFLDLKLLPDGRCEATSFNGINYRDDTQPLPPEFLDSSAALAIAEALYGQRYREQGKVFRVPVNLTTWRSYDAGPEIPDRAAWQIQYLTTRERERVDLFLTLDAVTGEELRAVEYVDAKAITLTNKFSK